MRFITEATIGQRLEPIWHRSIKNCLERMSWRTQMTPGPPASPIGAQDKIRMAATVTLGTYVSRGPNSFMIGLCTYKPMEPVSMM